MRLSFLTRSLDLSSIESLNRAFFRWVEDEYNAAEHSVIGMKPIDRFGLDLKRIRFLPPHEVNEELFFVEETRKTLADNTFSLRSTRFEAQRDLRNRTIEVRFDRQNFGRVELLPTQGEILSTLRVHCPQGSLCVLVDEPDTGKSVTPNTQDAQKLSVDIDFVMDKLHDSPK